MEQIIPSFLYHGRQTLVDIINPEQAPGHVKEEDRLCAVYASHDRRFAIPSALPILPDAVKGLSWEFRFEGEEPRVKIIKGWLHPTQAGYLYRVSSDTFKKIDEFRWVSFAPVTPLDYEMIHPLDYLHWFETTKVVFKKGSYERRRNDQRFALAVTLSRIMNSLTSSWRWFLSHSKQDSVFAQRDRLQAFLYNVALLYEGIKTFCENQVHLRDLDWFNSHLEDIKVIIKENGDSKSFYNTVMKEIRHKLAFHFNTEVDSELLSNPDIKFDHPLCFVEGISTGIGESVHPLADKLIAEYLLSTYRQNNQESVKFEDFLPRADELQRKFVDIIGHLIAELLEDDIEIGERA
jgi:hypothetical protein